MNNEILGTRCVTKAYDMENSRLEVLKGVDLSIRKGEAVCIMGVSGAGKSTLLHILGTLDMPSLGKVYYHGEDLTKKNDDQLAQFRNEKMGFVFQFHHLLPELTAIENVALPARVGGRGKSEAEAKAKTLLDRLGMGHRLNHYPSEMSGGERQRVAIARALVQDPEMLFADEPSGNLDSENGRIIQDLFFELQEELGLTLIVVTHDQDFADRFPKVYKLKNGVFI
ncbi:MAG: ABC transporter ATP-binding protein [Pseudomonadota bacterium]